MGRRYDYNDVVIPYYIAAVWGRDNNGSLISNMFLKQFDDEDGARLHVEDIVRFFVKMGCRYRGIYNSPTADYAVFLTHKDGSEYYVGWWAQETPYE
jgi:hypothetical protein